MGRAAAGTPRTSAPDVDACRSPVPGGSKRVHRAAPAAELSAQTGETVVARKLLDRALEGYPGTADAEIARLSRSIMAMRDGRSQDAARDLRTVVRAGGPAAGMERRALLESLTATSAPAGPGPPALLHRRYATGQAGLTVTDARPRRDESAGTLEGVAAPFLDGAGDPG